MAKSSDTELPDGVRHIKFDQYDLLRQYKSSRIYIEQSGVCFALSADCYRFYKKRQEASIYKDILNEENVHKLSFLYKEALRPYIKAAHDLPVPPKHSTKTDKQDHSFVRRMQCYYSFAINQYKNKKTLAEGKVGDINLIGLMSDKKYLQLFFRGFRGD